MALDPRGENRSYSGYGNKDTGAGSYSNKSGKSGAGATSSGSDDKRQKKQGIQVALGNAYYDKNGAYVVLRKPATATKSSAVTAPAGPTAKITGSSTPINFVSPSLGGIQSTPINTKASSAALTSIVGSKSATSTVPTTDAYVSMYKNQSPTGAIDYSKSTSTDPNDGKNLSFNNNTVADKPKYNQAYYANLIAPKIMVPGSKFQPNGKNIGGAGMTQAEVAAIQANAKVLGNSAYSGASVISNDNMKTASDTLNRVTGSDAVLGNGVTRNYTQSGLFGENIKGEFSYKDGTKITTLADDPVVRGTFNPKTGRIEDGFRLGNRQVTTFAGTGNYTGDTAGTGATTTGSQVAVNTMSGGEDGLGGNAVTTKLTAAGSAALADVITGKLNLDDIVNAALIGNVIKAITTVDEVDKIIEKTKDPDILKSLYQRRLSLMRLGRTRTRFAGLLDDPDTKKSQMSIV
jgi:hypothetical protein